MVIDLVMSSGPQAAELMTVFRGAVRRVVMLSSMDVYRAISVAQGMDPGPLQEVPLTEESELRRGLHPYPPEQLKGLRKIFAWVTDDYDKIPAEQAVMNDPELSGTVLRLPMVYGPGDPLHRFWPVVKRIVDGRRQIIFPETLAGWRSARGYVENVAAAIALAATDDRATGRIYNICEEPPFSELEWARKIAHEMQWGGEFVVLPVERNTAPLVGARQRGAALVGKLGTYSPRAGLRGTGRNRKRRSGERYAGRRKIRPPLCLGSSTMRRRMRL